MKLAGICFVIVVLFYFFMLSRKKEKSKEEEKMTETKDTKKESSESSKKIWKKKSLYIWLFILQFVVLNFIYPGGLFEVKAIFWFFATRNSDKVVNLGKPKRQKTLVEKPAPMPTTKMAWVLRLDGSFNHQDSEAVEIDEKSIFKATETEIMFSYYKRGEKHDVWLTREKTDEYYHGVLSLSDGTKQDLYLRGGGENFSGYIQQINGDGKSKKALLRKEEVMIRK